VLIWSQTIDYTEYMNTFDLFDCVFVDVVLRHSSFGMLFDRYYTNKVAHQNVKLDDRRAFFDI
jgi:hypothetical protein